MRAIVLFSFLIGNLLVTARVAAQDIPPPYIPGLPGFPVNPGTPPGTLPVTPPPAMPPYLYSIAPVTVNAGEYVHISLSASDPDSPMLDYSFEAYDNMPGAYINGSDFFWRATKPGIYRIKFIVSDGLWTDDEETTITVL